MDSVIQMNVRMERGLKVAGDEALSLIGLSPSKAVRALWEKASKRGRDLEEIAELLAPAKSTGGIAMSDADNPAARGWAMMDEALLSLGIDPTATWEDVDDKGVLAEALYERELERGL